MRLGAFDHLTKPIGREELKSALARMLVNRRADRVPAGAHREQMEGALVGASEAMRRVQKTIGMAADSDATVLILGETGTGKELVAHALHQHSRRHAKPFVAVNCAAIPSELLESELFGHVKGAFTGAGTDRPAHFVMRRAARCSSTRSATCRSPCRPRSCGSCRSASSRRSAANRSRLTFASSPRRTTTWRSSSLGRVPRGLFYRLNVVPIPLPPLRERLADIVPLAEHFLRLLTRNGTPKRLTAAAAARLLAHSWPGNVREIKNVIERASVLVRDAIVDADDLELGRTDQADFELLPARWLDADLPTALARLEKAMIAHALALCGGKRAEAARRLNINRQLLYAKMQRYGLMEKSASADPDTRCRENRRRYASRLKQLH